MQWVFIIVFIFLFILFLNRYCSAIKESRDCMTLYTGGLGSGKTYRAVEKGYRAWRSAVFRYHLKKIFYSKDRRSKLERPRLYGAGIRIRNKRGSIISEDMTIDHFLQRERMPEHSIVVFDEVGNTLSQWDFDLQRVLPELDQFFRWFRHFVDGKMFLTDQVSSNVSKFVRTRCNRCYNVSNFRRMWRILPFYMCDVEVLLTAEDSTTNVNKTQTNKEGMFFVHSNNECLPYFVGRLPYRRKNNRYDSRAYSEFYQCKDKPLSPERHGFTLKVEHLLDFSDIVHERRELMKDQKVSDYKYVRKEGNNNVSKGKAKKA